MSILNLKNILVADAITCTGVFAIGLLYQRYRHGGRILYAIGGNAEVARLAEHTGRLPTVVGSSLGGFYATRLAEELGVRAVAVMAVPPCPCQRVRRRWPWARVRAGGFRACRAACPPIPDQSSARHDRRRF